MKRLGGTITGAFANLAAQGIPFLLLLVVTPILLRALGHEKYGALILFNLVPQIAGQLDLGLSTAATRGFTQHAARGDRDGARRLFREALALLTAWGAVLGIVFYALHPAIASALKLDTVVADASTVYLAAALAVPLALANAAALVPLRAVERYGAIARVQVTVGIAYWSSCAWWAPRGGTLTQLVVLGTITVALATVALYVIARREHDLPPLPLTAPEGTNLATPVTPADSIASLPTTVAPLAATASDSQPRTFLLRPFLRLGAGAFIAQASSLATYNADKLLVSALISPAAAGAYAICTSIANKILLVIASGATFTFPRAARLHAEGDLDRVATTYAFATRISVLIASALAIPLIALAPEFLSIWIGPGFAADYGLDVPPADARLRDHRELGRRVERRGRHRRGGAAGDVRTARRHRHADRRRVARTALRRARRRRRGRDRHDAVARLQRPDRAPHRAGGARRLVAIDRAGGRARAAGRHPHRCRGHGRGRLGLVVRARRPRSRRVRRHLADDLRPRRRARPPSSTVPSYASCTLRLLNDAFARRIRE